MQKPYAVIREAITTGDDLQEVANRSGIGLRDAQEINYKVYRSWLDAITLWV